MKVKDLLELVHNFYKNRPYSSEGRFLLEDFLGMGFAQIYSQLDQEVEPSSCEALEAILKKREEGVPLAYILGEKSFFGHRFYVNPNVLIPRLETEFSVEELLKLPGSSFLELGLGSGAVSISLKLARPDLKVEGVDISEEALRIAKKNAQAHHCLVNFYQSDLFDRVQGRFDLIFSNPPYIESKEIQGLEREVKDHEPILALDGGEDGLDFYRRIIEDLPDYLNPGGHLVLEIGYNQGKSVGALLEEKNFSVKCIQDYAGFDRVLVASRREHVRKTISL